LLRFVPALALRAFVWVIGYVRVTVTIVTSRLALCAGMTGLACWMTGFLFWVVVPALALRAWVWVFCYVEVLLCGMVYAVRFKIGMLLLSKMFVPVFRRRS